MRVLLIEPDGATARSIELMLKSEGFGVYRIDRGEEGIELGRLYGYDAILLEVALPDVSGFQVVRKMRTAGVRTPILIVSGLAGLSDKIKGLGLGADDYITKPFHRDELVARIHAVVRRSRGHATSTIACGELAIDVEGKAVSYAGRSLHLTRREYDVIEILALRQGSVVTKGAIIEYLYSGMDEPDAKTIDVFVSKLRHKLSAASGGLHFIETTWGLGYALQTTPFANTGIPGRSIRSGGASLAHPRPGAPTRPVAHAAA